MNSRQLQYAVMLSEIRSFSQVAQELNISQPALSKQIISLENELGVKLFDRNTTPITITPAGEFFVQKASSLLFEEDILLKTMDLYKNGECGKLTIGVSPFRSLYMMPRLIQPLKKRYPHLQIVLMEYGRTQLYKGISEGLYDFAIMNLPIDDPRLEASPLKQDSVVLAVPNQLLHLIDWEYNMDDQLIDLACCHDLPFVTEIPGQEMRQLFDKLCTIAGIRPHVLVEVTGITSAREMVRAGIAAALLPRDFVQNNKNVTIFRLNQNADIRHPAIVTRRGQFVSEYAQFAIDLLSGTTAK